MKILKVITVSLLLSVFFNSAQAQDTTKKTTIISSDTTVIRKDYSTLPETKVVTTTQVVAPVSTPQPTEAEDYPQAGFHLGLRFQPGFTAIKSSGNDVNTISVSGKVGYGFGMSFAYYFNNYFGTQLELMYSTLSQQYTDKYNKTHNVDLNYISIPLIATLNSNYGKPVNINVAFGPQLGLLVGSKVSGNDGDFNAVLAAKGTDLGVGFGGGLDFALGPKHHTHINLGYRGVQGLLDIDNSNGSTNLSTNQYYILQKSKTNTNSLYLGIMFKL